MSGILCADLDADVQEKAVACLRQLESCVEHQVPPLPQLPPPPLVAPSLETSISISPLFLHIEMDPVGPSSRNLWSWTSSDRWPAPLDPVGIVFGHLILAWRPVGIWDGWASLSEVETIGAGRIICVTKPQGCLYSGTSAEL